MRVALLIAPFRDRTEKDIFLLKAAKARLVDAGIVPVFLPDTLREVLSDSITDQRTVALSLSETWLGTLAMAPGVRAVQVGDRVTDGMRTDIAAWRRMGGPLVLAVDEALAMGPERLPIPPERQGG